MEYIFYNLGRKSLLMMNSKHYNKKRCLLVLPRDIFPVDCGYAIKNHNLIKILGEKYDLVLVIISDHKLSQQAIDFYEENAVEVYTYTYSRYRFYVNALIALPQSIPLQMQYFWFKEVRDCVQKVGKNCDIVIGMLRTIRYFDGLDKIVVRVFDMVDSQAIIYKDAAKKTKSIFWRFLYSTEYKRLLKYERKYVKTSDVTFLFNVDEYEYYSNDGNVQLIPHGVNDNLFSYNHTNDNIKNSVVFCGKMNYQPNIDAVKWYLENVHCQIGLQIPLIIVGSSPTAEIIELSSKYSNIQITGYVDDPYVYMKSAMALIAPMQTGGGIQNKVLEGMALGKINVITTLAARPIVGARSNIHFIVANDGEDYSRVLLNIYENQERYEHIGVEAQAFVIGRYTWNIYAQVYVENIEHCITSIKKEVNP